MSITPFRFRPQCPTVRLHRLGITLDAPNTATEAALRLLDRDFRVVDIQPGRAVSLQSGLEAKPDLECRLMDGQSIHLVCQSVEALRHSLQSEHWVWTDYIATSVTASTHVLFFFAVDVVEEIEQAKGVMPFYHQPVKPVLYRRIVDRLRERGPLSICELAEHLKLVCHNDTETVSTLYPTLYGMVARAELSLVGWNDSAQIALPHPHVQLSPFPGLTYAQAIARIDVRPAITPIELSPLTKAERHFLVSRRGEQYRILYGQLANHSAPLKHDQLPLFSSVSGLSNRSIRRFKCVLSQLHTMHGVTTFEDLAPHLVTSRIPPVRRVHPDVEAVMTRCLEQDYFIRLGTAPRARHVSDVYETIRAACLTERLPVPAYNTVHRHIKRMQARDPAGTTYKRNGRDAAQRLAPRQGSYPVHNYGELITIDCTPADVMTRRSEQSRVEHQAGSPSGLRPSQAYRATLVVFGDVATSQILRIYVVDGRVNAEIVLLLLRRIILGQTGEFAQAGIQAIPQGQGLPQRIRIDGGTEFCNRQLARVLNDLGIEVLPRNARTRHFGGQEERGIQTMVWAHHALEGATTNSTAARKDYDPTVVAKMTLAELNRYQLEIQQAYNSRCAPHQPLTRHATAETLRQSGRSVWRQLTPKQLEYVEHRFHPTEMRRCQRSGIQLHGLVYTAPELNPLIYRRLQVLVQYNADDIRTAQVIEPETGALIPIYARLPTGVERTVPLDLVSWQSLSKTLKHAARTARDATATPQQIARSILNRRTTTSRVVGLAEPATHTSMTPAVVNPNAADIPVSKITLGRQESL